MKLWFYAIFMAWGMFLAIPCPFPKWNENARSRMLAVFPFIGLIIGVLWALIAYLMPLISCPKPLAALVLAAFPWLITGFIHLDGFSDVADALLSRRDLETKRRILKDPHIGAFGVIALILVILAQFCVFLTAEFDRALLIVLAVIPITTRACAGLAVLSVRAMDSSQYSKTEAKPAYRVFLALVMTACFALPILLFGVKGIAPLACAAVFWLCTLRGVKGLGGMNGDVSGFALTAAELAGTLILAIIG